MQIVRSGWMSLAFLGLLVPFTGCRQDTGAPSVVDPAVVDGGVVQPPALKPVEEAGFVVHPVPRAAVELLRQHLGKERVASTRYLARNVDLNGDDRPDAVVYLHGADACTDRGCTLLVLQGNDEGYRLHSTSTSVRLPVMASVHASDGWRDLLLGTDSHSAGLIHADGAYPLEPVARDASTAPEPTAETSAVAGAEILIAQPESAERLTPLAGRMR